jgi:HAD superfamily phosphatase (TIGR01668 family)
MSFSPIANIQLFNVVNIQIEYLSNKNISLLMLDLDNTLAPYGADTLSPEVLAWASSLTDAGIRLYIVSNTHKTERVARFASALGVPFVTHAAKPMSQALRAVLRELNIAPERAAMAGDQVYTDVLAGNFAGVTTILVQPIRLSNVFLAVRYACETPFRFLSRRQ